MTIISITHRLESVQHMDRIFVLSKGKTVENGTHEELLTRQEEYSALWNKQSGFEYKDQTFHITAERLQGIPLLSDLDATLLEKISNRFTTEIFEPGTEILTQGNKGKQFFIIGKGIVDVEQADDQEKVHQLAPLETGDYFGEISLLANIPITATVRARTTTYCLTLSSNQFNNLLQEVPALHTAIQPMMDARLKNYR